MSKELIRRRLSLAGAALDIGLDCPALAARVDRLYGPYLRAVGLPNAGTATAHPDLWVERAGVAGDGRAPAPHDDDRVYRLLEPAASPSHRDRRIVGSVRTLAEIRERAQFRLIDAQHHSALLHGAAIARGGVAVLFPARSGAGKTTLSAWFASQGEAVLTDELIALHPDGRVEGFAQALNIKCHGMPVVSQFPGLADALDGAPGAGLGGRFLPLPPSSVDTPLAPGLLVFPQYRPGAGLTVTPVSAGEALATLLESLMNARHLPRRGLGIAGALVRAVPAARIEYDDLGALNAWLGERLACLRPTA